MGLHLAPGAPGIAHLLLRKELELVTVEMSRVSFIDSSGLSALISGLKTLRQAGGGLNLAAVGAQARTALRLTLLDTVLPIYATVAEATTALTPKA